MANKKEKKESAKKSKYAKFKAGKDKRIEDINKSVKSYNNQLMGDSELIKENDNSISQFMCKNKHRIEKK